MVDPKKSFWDIELFPCSGGLAEGHRRAGITFDLALEWMEDHCDSYEHNIGHRPIQMDVRSFLDLLEMGWRPPVPIRYLCADPPCTPWSRAGKRAGQNDPRDMLDGTCRIIAILQPQIYLIGNVPGLDDGPNLPIVQRTIGALSKHGYCTADFARLDAANYGVPQHRIRPWWFGHKSGPCIQWPAPTHGDSSELGSPAFTDQLVIPGVEKLLPWVTCRMAFSHMTLEEIGRPIKLRHRAANSKQHGSVAERPARTVGTSNLSDGNVMLPADAPRAGKRGKPKNHGAPQGQRATSADTSSPTITVASGNQTIVSGDFELTPQSARGGMRTRDYKRPSQGLRVGDASKPAKTMTAKASRAGAGEHAVFDASSFTVQDGRGGINGLNTLDEPSKALLRNTHGNASILRLGSHLVNEKHPNADIDAPAPTLGAKDRGQGTVLVEKRRRGVIGPDLLINDDKRPSNMDSPSKTIASSMPGNGAQVISTSSKHPPSQADEPAMTQRGTDGGGNARALQWPWDRPSVTVLGDDRLPPPGHHDENYAIMSKTDGVVISERAGSILQGFPDFVQCGCGRTVIERPWEPGIREGDWCPECEQRFMIVRWLFSGKTKKVRLSQIGQAMPPPFAHAVASSVVIQLDRTERERIRELARNTRIA